MPVLVAGDGAIEHFVESHGHDEDRQPQPPVGPKPLAESPAHGCQDTTGESWLAGRGYDR